MICVKLKILNMHDLFSIESVTSCSQAPCRNGGTCREFTRRQRRFVRCRCPTGFRGRFCQNRKFSLVCFMYTSFKVSCEMLQHKSSSKKSHLITC